MPEPAIENRHSRSDYKCSERSRISGASEGAHEPSGPARSAGPIEPLRNEFIPTGRPHTVLLIGMVGAGRVGAQVALEVASAGVDDIPLVDIVPGLAEGEALDISHRLSDVGIDLSVTGSTEYSTLKGAKIVVVTAGFARKPGMTRMDLLTKNTGIITPVAKEAAKNAPDSILLMVTNPMDVMTYVAFKSSGFPKQRVVGMSGLLDNSGFKYVLAKKLDVSRSSITSLVMGEHGENMIPVASHTYISGVPLTSLLSEEEVTQAIEDTRKVAAEVISKKGAPVFAPGRCVTRMVEAIAYDKKEVLSASTYLEGEYGLTGLCIGVPIRLGKDGVEMVYELKLSDRERDWFNKGADTLREAIASLTKV